MGKALQNLAEAASNHRPSRLQGEVPREYHEIFPGRRRGRDTRD